METEASILRVGTIFNDSAELKHACKQYAIQNNIEFVTLKSDSRRYTVKCKDPDCSWHLHATNIENTRRFSIKKLDEEHNCFGLMHTKHKQVTKDFIAAKIQEKLRLQPSYTAKEIQVDIKTELGVDITYDKAWAAKELATKNINGTYEESYAKLPKYCEDLVNSNPGTTAFIESIGENKFRRMFVSFGASAQGFAHCLPIIGLDGTHLKSKYLGILLTATSVDALGSLYPIAFAVVDAENVDNWLWFLTTLRKSILEPHAPNYLDNGSLVLLSDRQKGLVNGVESVFPGLPHGYCLRHLEENFHKQFKNVELKRLLWKAARAITKEEYDAALQDMATINPTSVTWLLEHAPPQHWAELYFPGHRYGHLTSNIAEALNSWLLEARELPILPMFERIRHLLMDWYNKRRVLEAQTPGILVKPIAEQIQQIIKDRARRYRFYSSNNIQFEVISGITMVDYLVNLELRTCSCRRWQSTGFPCGHAIAILMALKQDPQTYAKDFYTINHYRKTYENAILHPLTGDYSLPLQQPLTDNDDDLEDASDLDEASLLPPSTRRPAGRPKKRRIRGSSEAQEGSATRQHRQNRCGRCKGLGHSRRTCSEAI
jgi:MULE transposase domain/MuDR family transposase/SWIM zinc finger